MIKQCCGNCEFWDREFTLFTSFTSPKQVKAKCRNDASPTNNNWMLSLNEGQDCPVYKERK